MDQREGKVELYLCNAQEARLQFCPFCNSLSEPVSLRIDPKVWERHFKGDKKAKKKRKKKKKKQLPPETKVVWCL